MSQVFPLKVQEADLIIMSVHGEIVTLTGPPNTTVSHIIWFAGLPTQPAPRCILHWQGCIMKSWRKIENVTTNILTRCTHGITIILKVELTAVKLLVNCAHGRSSPTQPQSFILFTTCNQLKIKKKWRWTYLSSRNGAGWRSLQVDPPPTLLVVWIGDLSNIPSL